MATAPAAPGWWSPGIEPPVVGQPWQGVQWSLMFVGFLAYTWVVVTYSIAIGDVAMVAALVGLLLQREPLRLPAFMVIFAAFILWAALGYVHSSYPGKVLDWTITMCKIWLIALVAVNSLRTPQRVRFFIFFFLGAFALYPLRGAFFNYFLAGYNVFGRAIWNYIYANPNDLAALTLLPTAMVAALLVREPKHARLTQNWPRLAALAGAAMLPLLILMTQSRGALLALGVTVVLGLAGQKGKQRLRGVVLVALLLGALAPFAPEGVWDRLSGLTKATDTSRLSEVDEEGSAESRYAIWRVALALSEQHPITGVGLGAYSEAHAVQASRMNGLPRGSLGPRDTHSTYLNLLAEVGWPGLGLFLAIVASTLGFAEGVRRRSRQLMPESSRQLLYLELGVLAFLLASVFGSYAKLAFMFVYLSLVWAHARLTADALAGAATTARAPVVRGAPTGGGRSVAHA